VSVSVKNVKSMWMVQMKSVRAKDERPLKFVPMSAQAGVPLIHQPNEHFEKNC